MWVLIDYKEHIILPQVIITVIVARYSVETRDFPLASLPSGSGALARKISGSEILYAINRSIILLIFLRSDSI